jgi:cytochrome c-type biogenesis protein CcmH
LTDIENDVMCVSCREPLAVAQSPQALAERNYIRHLIALGQTKPQIEQALVGQYGPAVLGKPPAHGFNLTVYILPPAILVLGIGTLVVLLPKWRRRSRGGGGDPPSDTPGLALDPADAHRLDEELTRYGG